MDSQESIDMISISAVSTSEPSFRRIAPSFFHPPPPQIHLRSRLEVSDLQDNASKVPNGSDPSDSGYSSNESGIPSSFKTSSENASLSNSQPPAASGPVPAHAQGTWGANGLLDMDSGNGVIDSHEASTFDSSWWDNDPQLVDGKVWDPYMSNMGMEDPFGPQNTL
jgi:hypothetical protein